ncbi:DUF1707 and DUF2154 domain-containing protein [Streptomyces sp. AV19]|uniref:DUF1707 SHOCT-like domain-containing protein n=1 Tax=Streptomyces sp. AV19 TaxID=2793068 RepID=UPI0018FE650D|nr:DUF1707 domain-containing protein [Streptomyces sp. AV19]MBH1935598.1 DUF1707 and DUF2154 domain-containing protein [Streptomyces sp. AV19]MDG4534485.1 DUF1707 domain-containing protein [Streptomyces sp. AV19]
MDESALEKRQVPLTKTAEPALRASDADRDRIADILREALAEGRLTADEHAERVDAVYRARTIAELEPLVHDLPAAVRPGAASDAYAPPRPPGAPVRPAENLIAVFGGATRKGRWRVGGRLNAFALFGGVEIDLTEALFEERQIVISTWALFGGVEVKVPENVSLRSTGTGIFGGFDVDSHEAADPEAPSVLITGCALFGGVAAKAKRGKRVKDLRAAE